MSLTADRGPGGVEWRSLRLVRQYVGNLISAAPPPLGSRAAPNPLIGRPSDRSHHRLSWPDSVDRPGRIASVKLSRCSAYFENTADTEVEGVATLRGNCACRDTPGIALAFNSCLEPLAHSKITPVGNGGQGGAKTWREVQLHDGEGALMQRRL